MSDPIHIRNQAPEIPEYYVHRPIVGNALKKLLLEDTSAERLLVSAVHGLGGIGKTTLVAALCRDPEIQNRYPDGILWAVLGQKPDVLGILGNWVRDLGDAFRFTGVNEASAHLANLLKDRRVLLVVDDAWEAADLEPFLIGGAECRIVITTRIAELARRCDAHLYNLDIMSRDQALELFQKRLGRLAPDTRHKLMDLAEELGFLPLAIELAAARLRDGADAAALLTEFRAGVANLDTLNLGEAERRNESLRVCFRLSLDQLEPKLEQAFHAFGILPEDARVHPAMCATLWETDEDAARRRLAHYRDCALLKPVSGDHYTIHDLLHDEAGLRLKELKPPARAHEEFLNRHYAKTKDGAWHTLPDDDYIHRYLLWHCLEAGRRDLVHAIMSEETSSGENGWHKVRETSGAHAGYIQDLGTAWEVARRDRSVTMQIRYALMNASLVSLAHHVAPPLLRELLKRGIWSGGRALAYARNAPGVLQRLQALAVLVHHLPDSMRREVHEEFFILLGRIQSEREKGDALVHIAEDLPPLYRREYQEAAASIQAPVYRLRALAALELLPGETLLHELGMHYRKKDDDQEDDFSREIPAREAFELHLELLRNGHEYLLDDTLEHWRKIEAPIVRARYLMELRPFLNDERGEELARTFQGTNTMNQAGSSRIRSTVAPLLAPEDRLELFQEIKAGVENIVTEDSQRGAEILLRMTEAAQDRRAREWLIEQGLLALQMVEAADSRAMVFNQTAAVLDDPALLRALELVHEINDGHVVLLTVKEFLPVRENFDLLLAAARKPRGAWKRARGLAVLVPDAPDEAAGESLAREALEEARGADFAVIQAEIIKSLLPFMNAPLREEALAMSFAIGGASHRLAALNEFPRYLEGEERRKLMLKCLELLPLVRRSDVIKTWLTEHGEELRQNYREELRAIALRVNLPDILARLFSLIESDEGPPPTQALVEKMLEAYRSDSTQVYLEFEVTPLEKYMTADQLIKHWLHIRGPEAPYQAQLEPFPNEDLIDHLSPETVRELFEKSRALTNPEERIIIGTGLAPALNTEQVALVFEDFKAVHPRDADLSFILAVSEKLSEDAALELLDKTVEQRDQATYFVLTSLIPITGHRLGPRRLRKLREIADEFEEPYQRITLLECLTPFVEPPALAEFLDLTDNRRDDEDFSYMHLRLNIALRRDAVELARLRELLRAHPEDLAVRAALIIRAPLEELGGYMLHPSDEHERIFFLHAVMTALPHASPERFFAVIERIPEESDGYPILDLLQEIDTKKRLFYANYGAVEPEVLQKYFSLLAFTFLDFEAPEVSKFTDEVVDPERRRRLTALIQTVLAEHQFDEEEGDEFPDMSDYEPPSRTPHPAFDENFSAEDYESWCKALNTLAGRSRPNLLRALPELIARAGAEERARVARDILRVQRWWP